MILNNMKLFSTLVAILFMADTTPCFAKEPSEIVRNSLLYAYGVKDIDIAETFHPHHDLWMIPHKFDENQVKEIKELKISVEDNSVFTETVGQSLIYTEITNGKVAPGFYLKGIYSQHERLILMFLYAALLRDEKDIARYVSHANQVTFDKTPKAANGDMDVYAEILSTMPIVRSSDPVSDAKEKSITYRVPLGKQGTKITLRRFDGKWKIDSSNGFHIPMEFFWR